MILRKEPSAFNPKVIEQLELDPKEFFKTPKPVAILTNTLSSNLIASGNPMFRDPKYKKIVLSKPSIVERFNDFSPNSAHEFA